MSWREDLALLHAVAERGFVSVPTEQPHAAFMRALRELLDRFEDDRHRQRLLMAAGYAGPEAYAEAADMSYAAWPDEPTRHAAVARYAWDRLEAVEAEGEQRRAAEHAR